MPASQPDNLREKVNTLLRDALTEADPDARAKLLGKAVHWTNMAKKAAGKSPHTA